MQSKNAIRLLASLALLQAPCSYSEPFEYGATQNAVGVGLKWQMGNVLPPQTGLSVNGVIYRYSTIKDTSADMKVSVQNEDAYGIGYVFRETDDWSGLPGNTINKIVPIEPIGAERWGDGSIAIEGDGQVVDPTVIYTYTYDVCADPQSNPICPGYVEAVDYSLTNTELSVYNALEDESVLNAISETDLEDYDERIEEEADRESEEEREQKRREERALAGATNALALANTIAQDAQIAALNGLTTMSTYYAASISGGVYSETVALVDANLPDAKSGLRNGLAQQLLHNQMVDMQYKRKK